MTTTLTRPDRPVSDARDMSRRRRYSAEYTLRSLEEADRCAKPGGLGPSAEARGALLILLRSAPIRLNGVGSPGPTTPSRGGLGPRASAATGARHDARRRTRARGGCGGGGQGERGAVSRWSRRGQPRISRRSTLAVKRTAAAGSVDLPHELARHSLTDTFRITSAAFA